MRLISVNVAQPQVLAGTARGDVLSAINKRPVSGPVAVRRLNVDGDAQADPENHGGPDAAVYVYALEDYAYWQERLDREFGYGWFGENLTVEGAASDIMCFGDVWQVGSAVLQVTEPRSPCFKLEHKMGIRNFAAQFQRAGRVGFYNRVLEEGVIRAGDEARCRRAPPCRSLHQTHQRRPARRPRHARRRGAHAGRRGPARGPTEVRDEAPGEDPPGRS